MSTPRPSLKPQASKVFKTVIDNPFDTFYRLRNTDTAGEKRLSFGNTWTHIKSNFVRDDLKQAYLSANLTVADERMILGKPDPVSFASSMSPIKLLNPFRYLYSAISLAGMAIAKTVDTIIPGQYTYNEKKEVVSKRMNPIAGVIKTILLSPFALANTLIGPIASLDKYVEPVYQTKKKPALPSKKSKLNFLTGNYAKKENAAKPARVNNDFNKKGNYLTSAFSFFSIKGNAPSAAKVTEYKTNRPKVRG